MSAAAAGAPERTRSSAWSSTTRSTDATKGRLLTREFGGGAKISLQTLADELGVSPSPVRHALTRLTSEGLVLSEPRGYVVRRSALRANVETGREIARAAIERGGGVL